MASQIRCGSGHADRTGGRGLRLAALLRPVGMCPPPTRRQVRPGQVVSNAYLWTSEPTTNVRESFLPNAAVEPASSVRRQVT